jgi:DNA-binding CsgD family transcriptional regulator
VKEEAKVCFVVTPIGDEGSETRLRSDQVFTHIIEPVVKELGYKPLRASDIPHPGMITHQIIEHLLNADLVVAYLTDGNPNVFYELGIRHMTRKPVVSIVDDDQRPPFDVNQSRTILLNHRDLDSAANCRDQLILQIRSLQEKPEDFFNPVSVSIDLEALYRSGDPDAQGFAQIYSMLETTNLELSQLRSEVRDLEAPRRGKGVSGSLSITEANNSGQEREITVRQVSILMELAKGKNRNQVANELGLSVSALTRELFKAYRTLGVENRQDAVVVLSERYPDILAAYAVPKD